MAPIRVLNSPEITQFDHLKLVPNISTEDVIKQYKLANQMRAFLTMMPLKDLTYLIIAVGSRFFETHLLREGYNEDHRIVLKLILCAKTPQFTRAVLSTFDDENITRAGHLYRSLEESFCNLRTH